MKPPYSLLRSGGKFIATFMQLRITSIFRFVFDTLNEPAKAIWHQNSSIMNPKLLMRAITVVMALFVSTGLFAQEVAKRIEIKNVSFDLSKVLVENGIDLQCGLTLNEENVQLDLQPTELNVLNSLNIPYEVVIEDLYAYYQEVSQRDLPLAKAQLAQMKAEKAAKAKASLGNATQDSFLQYTGADEVSWAVPSEFNLGASFGGCLTVSETMNELDDMNSMYPGLISARADASPFGETTYGNNSAGSANDWAGQTVYYVRMTSDQASPEGSKPAMLFTSMIHAREVSSLMSNIYFMWYLLENYGNDERVTELLDNNEIYFIPIVNPDGLLWNETIAPGGGGMQRKNLRPDTGSSTVSSGNTSRGVDLNRNFDYFWGSAGSGSSSSGSSDSYRGPSAFSEPESRILRDFILFDGSGTGGTPVRDFQTVLMNHSSANAIPHPYGGNATFVSGREDEMHAWHAEMTRYNRFVYGATIFSAANGIADDWMVGGPADANGSVGSGHNILGTTPEHGSTGFWPASGDIIPIAQNAVRIYMASIYYGGKYAKFHDMTQSDLTTLNPTLTFGIERVGQTASDFTLTVTPVSANITSGPVALNANGLGIVGATARTNVATPITLDANIQPNDKVVYTISLANDSGSVIYETEMEKVYQPTVFFSDEPDTDGLTNWTATGNWNNSTADGYSGTRSIRNATGATYANNSSGNLTSDPIDISAAGETVIQFYTKYDMERNYDYVEVLASAGGSGYTPLVGKFTKPEATSSSNGHAAKGGSASFQSGSSGQVIDGDTFDEWVMEEFVISLSENSQFFGASDLQVRFRYATDGNNRGENFSYDFDGFYIDDFKVIQTSNEVECNFDLVSSFPYTEDWESGLGLFSQSQGDDGNWSLNTGGTVSNNTGPDQGNDAASGGGQYLYTEASTNGLGFNANVLLTSGCIDLSGHYGATISLDYHMYGAAMGTLAIEVSNDGGLSWNQEFSVSGQQQTSNADAWTTQLVDLSAYGDQVIRVRINGTTGNDFTSDIAIDNFVLNAIPVCSVTTTYSGGSWDNGTPTANVRAVIASDYDMNSLPSIDACSLEVLSGVTLTVAAGTYVNVNTDITVNTGANLDIQHEGSVVQIEDSSNAVNNGSITATKTTPTLGFKEFSVMSSPLSASTRDVAFSGAWRVFGHNTALFDTNDAVSVLVGDAINFVDQTGNDRIPMTGSEALEDARGYLVVPFGPSSSGTYSAVYSQGNLNNGLINKSLIYNGSPEESANLIGNPYASAINAYDFLAANAHIPELYFWNQNTAPAAGPGYLAYSMEDISQFNAAGGIPAASDPGNIPNEYVASGQGFGVKPLSNANAVFNNGMREKTNNTTFKTGGAADLVTERIWLQLNNAAYTEASSTALIAFTSNATNGVDIGYDSKRIGTYVSLFSTVNDLELGIQGRETFKDDAIVPMGFSTLLEESTAYTISIAQVEGNKLTSNAIYLKDLETGVIINLSERDYVFTATQGHYPERFELFFKDRALDTQDLGFSDATVLLYPNPAQNAVQITNTSNEAIQSIQVYDLQGRMVINLADLDQFESQINVGQLPHGVYMVSINTTNAQVVKRLIKN